MNHGRIEQVDDPLALYNRPRTRFVASFIGRTNILDGRRDGASIVFPGFTVPAAAAPRIDPADPATTACAAASASFSIRPQTIRMHRAAPADANAHWWVDGRIVERAYLGEYWEYVVRAAANLATARQHPAYGCFRHERNGLAGNRPQPDRRHTPTACMNPPQAPPA